MSEGSRGRRCWGGGDKVGGEVTRGHYWQVSNTLKANILHGRFGCTSWLVLPRVRERMWRGDILLVLTHMAGGWHKTHNTLPYIFVIENKQKKLHCETEHGIKTALPGDRIETCSIFKKIEIDFRCFDCIQNGHVLLSCSKFGAVWCRCERHAKIARRHQHHIGSITKIVNYLLCAQRIEDQAFSYFTLLQHFKVRNSTKLLLKI